MTTKELEFNGRDRRERSRRSRRRRRRRTLRRCLAGLTVLLIAVAAGVLLLRERGLPGEGGPVPETVEEDLLPVNRWSRPGTPLERIDGVVLHYVGNPNTTARANRNYFASLADGREGTYASSHFIVGLEGEVLQCVPLTEVAYASNLRNEDTVSIEVCHPDDTGEFSAVTYQRAVELTAWLCRSFDLDPAEDVIRHYDVTGKVCPRYYVDHPEAWEQFLADTAVALAELGED